MEIVMVVLLIMLGFFILFKSLKGKPAKRKFIIIGTTIMATSPFLAFAIGISYGVWAESGFASLIMIYIFPALLILGLFVLLMGVLDKNTK